MTDPLPGTVARRHAKTSVRGLDRAQAAAFVAGASALAGSWAIVAARDVVPAREVEVFELLNGLPDALWPAVWVPMQAGSFLGSVAVVGLAAAVTRDRRLTLAALAASQGAYWGSKLVKSIVTRERPAALLTDLRLREDPDGFGYVSGHAAVAVALAAALAPSMPARWRPVAIGGAVVVGFGRIYAGAHLPLDVVGGGGIGLLLGTVTRWVLGLGGEGLPSRPVVHDL